MQNTEAAGKAIVHSSRERINDVLERFARSVAEWVGTSWAFSIAATVVVVWALAGPLVSFSEGWQLLINTSTTIVTFLMVFLIQRSQNKEARAVQLKLNELLAALEGASTQLIDAEQLSEAELGALQRRYRRLVELTASRRESRSVEDTDGAGDPRD